MTELEKYTPQQNRIKEVIKHGVEEANESQLEAWREELWETLGINNKKVIKDVKNELKLNKTLWQKCKDFLLLILLVAFFGTKVLLLIGLMLPDDAEDALRIIEVMITFLAI